jgi:hypothetical protein
MKTIRIRHAVDKALYFGPAGWSLNLDLAREFNTPLEAIAFIIQRQIGHAELVSNGLHGGRTETAVPMEVQAVAAQAR